MKVSVTEPSDPVKQGWPTDRGTSTGAFAQVEVLRLALWLVGWLVGRLVGRLAG